MDEFYLMTGNLAARIFTVSALGALAGVFINGLFSHQALRQGMDAFAWSFLAGPVIAAAHWPLTGSQHRRAFWFAWITFMMMWLLATGLLDNFFSKLPGPYHTLFESWSQSRELSRLVAVTFLPLFLGLSLDLGTQEKGWFGTQSGFWMGLGFGPLLSGVCYEPAVAWQLVVPAFLLALFSWPLRQGEFPVRRSLVAAARTLVLFHFLSFCEPFLRSWGVPEALGTGLRLLGLAFILSPRPRNFGRGLSAAALGLAAAYGGKWTGLPPETGPVLLGAGIAAGWLLENPSTLGVLRLLAMAAAWYGMAVPGSRLAPSLLNAWCRDGLWMPAVLALVSWKPSVRLVPAPLARSHA